MRIKVTAWMEMPLNNEYTDEEIYDWLCEVLCKPNTNTEFNPNLPLFAADNIMWVMEKKEGQ